MLKAGNVSPTGTRLPKPDLLLLSYTGCYTFMKWFELLREEYRCPVVFLQVPYHTMLSRGFDPVIHRMLLSTNRLRTATWTLRGFLVLSMAWSMTS
jgi:hypothetical protein